MTDTTPIDDAQTAVNTTITANGRGAITGTVLAATLTAIIGAISYVVTLISVPTITGGTINNAPIGATIPAPAIFTTLQAASGGVAKYLAGDNRYTKPDGTLSTDPTATYGQMPMIVGSVPGSHTSAAFFSLYNDIPIGDASFPIAVTAHAELHSAGGTVFGYYGEATTFTTGVVTHELDTFNKSGVDAPSTFPFNRALGTSQVLPISITCGAGTILSLQRVSAACMEIVQEGSTLGQFQYGIAIDANSVNVAGIVIDANTTQGPNLDLSLKNTGVTGHSIIDMTVTGAFTAANPVMRLFDATGADHLDITQDGSIRSSANVTALAYFAGATAGVTCSGSPTSSFASTNGIVTHC